MFKGTMTKWPVQKLTQWTTQNLLQHHDGRNRHLENIYFLFFGFFFFIFFFIDNFLKELKPKRNV